MVDEENTDLPILVVFNDKTRAFIRGLQDNELSELLRRCELLRMIIWDPEDKQAYKSEECKELDLLLEASIAFDKQDFRKVAEIYDRQQIISNPFKSLMINLMAGCDSEFASPRIGTKQMRKLTVMVEDKRLGVMRAEMDKPGHIYPQAWKAYLDLGIARSLPIMGQIQEEDEV